MNTRLLAFAISTLAGGFVVCDAVLKTWQAAVNQELISQAGELCIAGDESACLKLVEISNGHCAGPVGSGCKYQLGRDAKRL